MKTQEEIEQLANEKCGYLVDEMFGFIKGYTQCQEDVLVDGIDTLFVEGYNQCQEDMAVKIKEAYKQGLLEGYACMPSIEGMPLINSLNKQD